MKDTEIKIKCYEIEKVYGSEYAINELKSICGRIQKMLLNNLSSPAQDNGGEELKIAADKVLREVLIKYIEGGKISSKNREHAIIEAMIIFKNKH